MPAFPKSITIQLVPRREKRIDRLLCTDGFTNVVDEGEAFRVLGVEVIEGQVATTQQHCGNIEVRSRMRHLKDTLM